MKEFKTVAFAGFEKSIRDAHLTRSAMIGEMLGNAIAEGWFSIKVQAARIALAIAAKDSALKGHMAAPRHLNSRKHAATLH